MVSLNGFCRLKLLTVSIATLDVSLAYQANGSEIEATNWIKLSFSQTGTTIGFGMTNSTREECMPIVSLPAQICFDFESNCTSYFPGCT